MLYNQLYKMRQKNKMKNSYITQDIENVDLIGEITINNILITQNELLLYQVF